ncbi:MAG: DUF4266 domain-containing protein [Bacteroidota bacterium]
MKTRHSKILLVLLIVLPGFVFNSCTAVKPFQKMYLNDGEMELSSRKAEKFEQSFQLYREGASGANGGKSGGGCGCN